MNTTPYLMIEKDKNGEWDFSVWSNTETLSLDEMQKLRAMIVVAIGTMEHMWRRAQEAKPENQASARRIGELRNLYE